MTDRTVNVRYNALLDTYKAVLAEGAVANKAFTSSIEEGITRVSGHFGNLGQQAGKSLAGIVSDLGPVGLAVGAVAAGITALGVEGIKSFVELGSEVRQFQRLSGASAETSSEWVAVLKDVGVGADTGAAGLFRLSRQINQHADTLRADGVEIVKGKNGQVDLTQTLLSVGDAYKKAGSGAAGNQIAFDAFGRSGAALIPILAKSREELQAFIEEARKHGEILTQGDLEQARQYQLAIHSMGESFQGLERSIAVGLVGPLTGALELLTKITDLVAHASEKTSQESSTGKKADSFIQSLPGGDQIARILRDGDMLLTLGQSDAILGKNQSAAARSAADLKAELADQAQAAGDDAKAQAALNKALQSYVDVQTGSDQAASGFESKLQKLAASLRDNGASLDENTVKGNDNRQAMQAAVTEAESMVKSLSAQGVAGKDVQSVLDAMAQKLMVTAQAHGVAAGEAQHFADLVRGLGSVLNALPASTSTDVHVNTAQAYADLARLVDLLNQIDRAAAQNAARQAAINNDPAAGVASASASFTSSIISGLKPASAAQPTPKSGGGGKSPASGGKSPAQIATDAYLAAVANQQQVEDAQWQHGFITNEKYKQLLDQRLATATTFSQDWFAIVDKEDAITARKAQADQAAADAAQKAADAEKKAADDQAAALKQQNDALLKSLQDQESILADQLKVLQQRRDDLFGWADPSQKTTVGWANSTSALTKNIQDQTSQLKEWGQLMAQLESEGLSSTTIDLLGLNKGPSSLAELRQLAKDPSQLSRLNAAAGDRSSLAEALAIAQPAQVNVAVQATFVVDGQSIPINIANLSKAITQLNNEAQAVGAH